MIKNEELYDFDEKKEPSEPETVELEQTEGSDFESSSRFIHQVIMATLCLIFYLLISQSDNGWLVWTRAKLNQAINAPTEATFGRIWNSGFFQGLIKSTNNLIRLEQVTNTMAPFNMLPRTNALASPVWPVQGEVIGKYGWRYNSSSLTGEFYPGTQFETAANANVIAIADGRVSKAGFFPETGFTVIIEHESGWSSEYQNLAQIDVAQGNTVSRGTAIGKVAANQGGNKGRLTLILKHYGETVDPLSVLTY